MDLVVNVEGHSCSDLESGLEEALRLVREGNLSGMNSSDTGSFSFDVSGEEVVKYGIRRSGVRLEVEFDSYDDVCSASNSGDVILGLSEHDIEVFSEEV